MTVRKAFDALVALGFSREAAFLLALKYAA